MRPGAPKVDGPAAKKKLALDVNRMAEGGERNLDGGEFLTTARAANDVAITVRGNQKVAFTCKMHLTPTSLGDGKVHGAWRPGSVAQLAVVTDSHLDRPDNERCDLRRRGLLRTRFGHVRLAVGCRRKLC